MFTWRMELLLLLDLILRYFCVDYQISLPWFLYFAEAGLNCYMYTIVQILMTSKSTSGIDTIPSL